MDGASRAGPGKPPNAGAMSFVPPIPGAFPPASIAAATPQGLINRADLALLAVERTRMPMMFSDPRQPDNPIVLANQAFLDLTGYAADEVVGRNCQFLQGPGTDPAAIAAVRDAVVAGRPITIDMLNYRKDGTPFWNTLFISPVCDVDGRLLYFFASQKDITHERDIAERERAEVSLLREIDHRANNALALVQGIVGMSRADTAQGYASAVRGRVGALATAHRLLAERRWREVSVTDLLDAVLGWRRSERVTLGGAPTDLPPALVQPLALALHELATNAERHGALADDAGAIAIDWGLADDRLWLRWDERAGRDLGRPERAGFGRSLVTSIVERQLAGELRWHWRGDGLALEMRLPLTRPAQAADTPGDPPRADAPQPETSAATIGA